MSNDDRDAPRWGERTPEPEQGTTPLPTTPAAPAPDADQPRYGERVAPGSAAPGSAAPGSWSAPSSSAEPPAAPYSAPSGYSAPPAPGYDGQQQYAGQQQWGQPAPGSAQGGWAEKPKRPRTVGVIAFIAGIVALALGIVAAAVLGAAFGGIPGFRAAAQSGDSTALQHAVENDPTLAGPIAVGGLLYLAGTAFGIWAIVQGLIATIGARGRLFGILALVLGVIAPIVSVIVLTASIGSSLG